VLRETPDDCRHGEARETGASHLDPIAATGAGQQNREVRNPLGKLVRRWPDCNEAHSRFGGRRTPLADPTSSGCSSGMPTGQLYALAASCASMARERSRWLSLRYVFDPGVNPLFAKLESIPAASSEPQGRSAMAGQASGRVHMRETIDASLDSSD